MQIGQRTPLGAVQTNLLFLAGQVRGAKKASYNTGNIYFAFQSLIFDNVNNIVYNPDKEMLEVKPHSNILITTDNEGKLTDRGQVQDNGE